MFNTKKVKKGIGPTNVKKYSKYLHKFFKLLTVDINHRQAALFNVDICDRSHSSQDLEAKNWNLFAKYKTKQ